MPPITKQVRSEYYAASITDNIRKIMRQRDYLKKKAVKTGSQHFHDAYMYKRIRNYLNRIIQNIKTNYYMNTLNESNYNPKDMWKIILIIKTFNN